LPVGQIEAARAYGMSPWKVMRRVTLPAMLPHAIPGLSNLWLIATKDTALLAVVGFSELTLVTRQAAGTTKAYILFFCAAGVLYLALTLVSNVIIKIIERRSRRGFAVGDLTMSTVTPPLQKTGELANPSSFFKPHRIILMLIFVAIVATCAWFMRWDWLPRYIPRLGQGVLVTLAMLFSTAFLGFLLAVLWGWCR
jgi:ABC-type amino acid transport system permease subunit